MKLSLTLLPLLVTLGMAVPVPAEENPLDRRFSGGNLPEALASAGGIHGLLKSVLKGEEDASDAKEQQDPQEELQEEQPEH